MQGNFGWAIETHRKDARSCTYRGVADHGQVLSGASAHPSRQHRLQFDWNRPRQADLASVRMSTQHKIEVGMRSPTIELYVGDRIDRRSTKGKRLPVKRDGLAFARCGNINGVACRASTVRDVGKPDHGRSTAVRHIAQGCPG